MGKQSNQQPAITPIERTSVGLREAIFEEIDNLRKGVSNPARSNAMSKLVMSVVETVRMEIEVQRFINQAGPSAASAGASIEKEDGGPRPTLLSGPLQLGA